MNNQPPHDHPCCVVPCVYSAVVMSDFFQNIKRGVKEYARSSRTADGRSTLHIAVLTNSSSPVQTLLDAGVDRFAQDRAGNTALHVAAAEGAGVALRTLLTYEPRNLTPDPVGFEGEEVSLPPPARSVAEMVDLKNLKGETALHLACKANSLSCIEVLLENASDIYNMTSEGKQPVHYAVKYDSVESATHLLMRDIGLAHTDSNDQPLIHLAASKEMVELLVKYGVDANARDSTGLTALHTAVKNKNFQLLIALLLSGCPVDLVDTAGNTALHTCVSQNVQHDYPKTLLVFGAPLEAKNNRGNTAFQTAVQADNEEYVSLLTEVGGHDDLFLARGDREGKVRTPQERDHPRKRPNWGAKDAAVLCIDGGGMKGLVAIQILLEIEKRTQTGIVDMFDWVSGSSIGSLVVLAQKHAVMDNTIRGMQRVLFDLKNRVFEGSRPYKSDNLEAITKEIVGPETKMLDSLYPRIVITTTVADVRPCELHLFTNYGTDNEYAWKAARASGAAPTYFSPFENKYLDGGVMSNNPTLDTLVEMRKFYNRSDSEEPCQPKIVISVGTGLVRPVQVKDLDVGFRPKNPMEAAKFASSALEMFSTLIEQCALCDGPIVEQCRYWCDSVGSEYYRLQPDIESVTAMDEKSDSVLVQMCWETCSWVYRSRDVFAMLTDALYSGT